MSEKNDLSSLKTEFPELFITTPSVSTNVQVYPAKKRVELNDKATKRFFNLTRESYQKLLESKAKATLIEKKNHKKFGNIKSSFSISNENGFSNFIPLDEHDRAVLSVCVSNWLEGNRYITPAIIYRGLTGKVNDASGNSKPSPVQLKAILQSIDRLMFTAYDPQILDAYEKLEYISGDDKIVIKKSVVLPCYRAEVTVNGQTSDVIYFDRESPFLVQASLKKQMLTYDAELLDVPYQNNSPTIIAAKNYVMRRIQEIKLHKMTPTITFADIFKKCRIENADNKVKQRIRENIIKLFENLKSKNHIKSFEVVKKRNTFYSIKLTY